METREHKFITPTPATITNFIDYAKADYKETLVDYTIFPGEAWLWGDIPNRLNKGTTLPAHFRFNWNTPLVLSPHNAKTLYLGGNHLFMTTDRGETWKIISPDLTTNDPLKRNSSSTGGLTREVTGAENHCTIITISESPLKKGLIWVGTDDGNVQLTKDGGSSWKNVTTNIKGVPPKTWVSRVEASHFSEGRVYVTFDAHRNDNNKPYIFMTDDFGATWKDISAGIPDGNAVYVIREDFVNPDLLFVGTELTCFMSDNRGKTWQKFMNNMPTVAFYDLTIHPREADLIAGTHGRSLWILDDITPLQQLNAEVREKDIHMFTNKVATIWLDLTMGKDQSSFMFRGENAPRGASVAFWVKNKPAGPVKVTFTDNAGLYSRSSTFEANQGINRIRWNMEFPVTEKMMSDLRTTMLSAVKVVEKELKTKEDKALLTQISGEITNATTPSQLNAAYVRLTFNFGQYSKGVNIFGDMLSDSVKAVPGTYKVLLEVDGKTYESAVTLRADPILN